MYAKIKFIGAPNNVNKPVYTHNTYRPLAMSATAALIDSLLLKALQLFI